MNIGKKLTLGLVAALAFTTPLMAEEVTIGAEISPIASLVVLGGNTQMDFDRLVAAGSCANAGDATCEGAVKFFVNTNMPKWNVYLAFANGGILKNANDNLALVNAWLKFSADLNVCSNGDNCVTTASTVSDVTDIAVTVGSSNIQSMLTLAKASATLLADTEVPDGTNWFEASDINTFGVDLTVGAAGGTAPTLAGQYNETVYLTLATTY